jgi:hypothetical protein
MGLPDNVAGGLRLKRGHAGSQAGQCGRFPFHYEVGQRRFLHEHRKLSVVHNALFLGKRQILERVSTKKAVNSMN